MLHLQHGIGGDETEWSRHAQPEVFMDNLIANGKAAPMLIVMPNGRARKDDRAVGDLFAHMPAFTGFERNLLETSSPPSSQATARTATVITAPLPVSPRAAGGR